MGGKWKHTQRKEPSLTKARQGVGRNEREVAMSMGQVNQGKFSSQPEAWTHLAEGHVDMVGSILLFAEESQQSFGGGTDILRVEDSQRGTAEKGSQRYFQLKLIFKDINSACTAAVDCPC